jgi:hypothetical protein
LQDYEVTSIIPEHSLLGLWYGTKVMTDVTDVLQMHNHCCNGKAISITYSERVSVTLAIQHAKHKQHIILSYMTSVAVPNFSALSHKWQPSEDFFECKRYVLIFSTTFV